jgi:alkylation response protein AidB-like acyl-CoA dehydrogenase
MLNPLDFVPEPPSFEGFRSEIRAFLQQELAQMPVHERARSWMGTDIAFSRKLAQRGWLGLTIPESHGGAGLDFFARFVLSEELLVAGAPVAAHWIADRQSAPLIMRYGSKAQQEFYVPKICRAEAFFCIGMSEPNSGSDLASIRTRAVQTKTGWLLNGSKIWTTNAHHCHYMIALVRTSGQSEDRQQGLSQIIVDLSKPGVTIRPITDMAGDVHFNEVFFEDVQLAEDALIGQEGLGWDQVNAELAYERSGPERIYSSMVLLQGWVSELRQQNCNDGQAQAIVGRLIAQMSALRGMSLAVTDQLVQGLSPAVEASFVKDYGTAFEQRVIREISDWLAANPDFSVSGELMQALAYLEQMGVTFSLRGGTREILRGIIARGLALR